MRRLAVIIAMVVLGGCGGGTSSPKTTAGTPSTPSPSVTTPEATSGPAAAVESFLQALEHGDCRTAKRRVVTPSALDCGEVEAMAGSFAAEGIDLDAARYRASKVVDSSSTVKVSWDSGDPPQTYEVQRMDGRWRILFDSAA